MVMPADRAIFLEHIIENPLTISQIQEVFGVAYATARNWSKHSEVSLLCNCSTYILPNQRRIKLTLPIIPANRAFKQIKDFTDENGVPRKINKDDSGRQFPMGVVVHYLRDINDSMSVVDKDEYNFASFEEYYHFIYEGVRPGLSVSGFNELVDEVATANTHYVSVRESFAKLGDKAECKYYFLMTRPAYYENNLWEDDEV